MGSWVPPIYHSWFVWIGSRSGSPLHISSRLKFPSSAIGQNAGELGDWIEWGSCAIEYVHFIEHCKGLYWIGWVDEFNDILVSQITFCCFSRKLKVYFSLLMRCYFSLSRKNPPECVCAFSIASTISQSISSPIMTSSTYTCYLFKIIIWVASWTLKKFHPLTQLKIP